jgi:alkanesulfonate monooxygenase SsuD/methylene tetrahydromethanopterin reductase-like flavin-dependent oxidoreductase (luciferase family)
VRLASAVTVLSSDDPVRVFQQFATVDLLSQGRAEIVVGRGSFIESYPLFGFDLDNYDELAQEKLELLLALRAQTNVTWSGRHRAPLTGQGVYPRPVQNPLPVLVGVGGTPQSIIRAATLRLPVIIAIIGGQPAHFRPLADLYRQTWQRAGNAGTPFIGVHNIGFVADTQKDAAEIFWPTYQQLFTKLGRERGWPPVTRAQYDAQCGAQGALMVGDPETVAKKLRVQSDALGGLARITVQLDLAGLAHAQIARAIELLGTEVAPRLRAAN